MELKEIDDFIKHCAREDTSSKIDDGWHIYNLTDLMNVIHLLLDVKNLNHV